MTGTVNPNQTQTQQPSANIYCDNWTEDDTDTETSPDKGIDPDYSYAALASMTPPQINEFFFWVHKSARRNWRRHMKKPTRKARKIFKSKGKVGRSSFLADMSEDRRSIQFSILRGKGRSKGKSRSSGQGRGRRQNPIRRNGCVMTCGMCGSEIHFRAHCPQTQNRTSEHFTTPARSKTYLGVSNCLGSGPSGDLLQDDAQRHKQSHLPWFMVNASAQQEDTTEGTPFVPQSRREGVWLSGIPNEPPPVDVPMAPPYTSMPEPPPTPMQSNLTFSAHVSCLLSRPRFTWWCGCCA